MNRISLSQGIMVILQVLPLLCVVSAVQQWPALRTTVGSDLSGENFKARPLTRAGAEEAGFQLMEFEPRAGNQTYPPHPHPDHQDHQQDHHHHHQQDHHHHHQQDHHHRQQDHHENDTCNGRFKGHRYATNVDDPSLVLIYDAAGYIAGVQSGMFVSDVSDDDYPFSTSPFYQLSDFFGEPAYFTTAYFVDPAIICSGRTADEFEAQGTGDRLLIQNGPKLDRNTDINIPLKQVDSDASDFLYKHLCFRAMGHHYMQFNYEKDQDCRTVAPFQILYNEGILSGFVWIHSAKLPGDKWEYPTLGAISVIIDRPPTCVLDLLKNPGPSSMHLYFVSAPWAITCPAANTRSLSADRKFMLAKKK